MRALGGWLLCLPLWILSTGCELDEVLADSARYREDFHSTHPLTAGGAFALENFNGSVEILGWEKEEVRISAVKYARSQAELRALEIEVSAEPQAVRIRTVFRGGRRGSAGVRYLVRVPHRVELERIVSSNGALRIEDVRGAMRLETTNGSITFRRVEGPAEARTSNGSITADQLLGAARLRTSNGAVRLDRVDGELEAVTSNSSVTARVVRAPRGAPLRLESSNGSIELTVEEFQENPVRVATSNGAITVRLPASVQARLKAETSNGGIHSDFEILTRFAGKAHVEGDLGGGGAPIHLTTTNGSIRLLKL